MNCGVFLQGGNAWQVRDVDEDHFRDGNSTNAVRRPTHAVMVGCAAVVCATARYDIADSRVYSFIVSVFFCGALSDALTDLAGLCSSQAVSKQILAASSWRGPLIEAFISFCAFGRC